MTTLKDTLDQLGGVHDAKVTSIRWDAQLEILEFAFEDIYANFSGLANYPGREPGAILLRQVKELVLAMSAVGQAHIYEFSVEEFKDEFLATVLFWPNGKITAKFTSADFPEVRHLD